MEEMGTYGQSDFDKWTYKDQRKKKEKLEKDKK